MINSRVIMLLVVLLVIGFFALPTQAKYGGGSGEPNDPYLIYDANQMQAIGADANDWDRYFRLMADIDLAGFTGATFNIIGHNDSEPFSGVFDGNGHTISRFAYTPIDRPPVGLFGFVHGENAEITNLGLIGPDVDAPTMYYVGSLVGALNSGRITNCYAEGGSVTGRSAIGGLVGANENGRITNCYATSNVTGAEDRLGGLVGINDGTITNCYATGNVAGEYRLGGLVGYNDGTITNCYATGRVAGGRKVGGFVGAHYDGTITNCYATGSVTGTQDTGGFAGYNSGHVINCYWNVQTAGCSNSAGGEGKTTAQMMEESTFLHWGACGEAWTINEGIDYPRLAWEEKQGEPIVHIFPLEGSGDSSSPYLIHTADELNVIGLLPCAWDKHFRLTADIDLSVYTGTEFNIIPNFTGVFDGNDHTISNFTYASDRADHVGLFGSLQAQNTEIKNLRLIDFYVYAQSRQDVGSLVGRLLSGKISNCHAKGSVTGDDYVGGLVGYNYGTITDCVAEGSVNGQWRVGGLAGYDQGGTITNSCATGDVAGYSGVGGLTGYSYGTIDNCCAKGSVTGKDRVGGLVGCNYGTSTNCYASGSVAGNSGVGGLVGDHYVSGAQGDYCQSTITNCYATGNVTGIEYTGGLVGAGSGHVISSYWNIETSGQAISAGGEGKTTTQMRMASTFLGWGFCGWVWTINEDLDYPRLAWEEKPGEPIVGTFPLDGNGDSNSPYLIHTSEELNLIGLLPCAWDKNFKVTADIDLSLYKGTEFNIIPNFTGVFDGNVHTISNFTYDSSGTDYIGLFGRVYGENAEIKNLGLIAPNVDAGTGDYVSSLVGELAGGTITDCYSEGGSVTGVYPVGGLVGYVSGTITNCYSSSTVWGYRDIGGLVGHVSGTITNCSSSGTVWGYSDVGGLVGINSDTITDCYSTGSVTGEDYVGGLVGYVYGTITNCYSTGTVWGEADVGGLAGYSHSGSTVNNSFWDTESSGQLTSAGGTGKTTGEMQVQSTFADAGWDIMGEDANSYGNIWRLCNKGGEYPKLSWQYLPGDFLCPDYVDFVDFAYLAGCWLKPECDGADLTFDAIVNALDLTVENDNWLTGMPPGQASNQSPIDGAISVSTDADLNWTAGPFAASHDLYFGTSTPPLFICNQTATVFDPGIIAASTKHYWRIDEVNPWGKSIGPVWIFTTGSPDQATNPDPADGRTGVSNTVGLKWNAGYDAISHDVYFGTSNPPPFICNQVAMLFYPDIMSHNTKYYWRIDELNAGGKTVGTVWTFTTTSYVSR